MESRTWHASYDAGVSPSPTLDERSLTQLLEGSEAEYGNATALIFMNCRMTYRQLQHAIDRFATGLSGLGVRRNSRVAIYLPNLPQTVIA